jgi:hypothetical protein
MELNWLEWFGYLGSLVVLISFTMSSIIKLRITSVIGCLLFAAFAYLTDSIPTLFMNISIACINLYFLFQVYRTKEEFEILSALKESDYYQHFIEINRQEIEKQISLDELKLADTLFYMLRDNNIAGVLAGKKDASAEGCFEIMLDYVTPRYRDFKLGTYYYKTHPEFLKEKGIMTLKTTASDQEYCLYLNKMGFVAQLGNQSQTYIKRL